MKIPFTLDAWLKDKSQKVETREGRPVKIISFEMTDTNDCPIAAQFRLCAGTPVVYLFDKEGHYKGEGDSDYDLFLITPEPELSEFGMKVSEFAEAYELAATDCESEEYKTCNGNLQLIIDKYAAELLDLARKEIVRQGYVIEKKTFHDAVEKIDDKNKAEMSIQYSLHCKVENGTRHAVMNWESFQKLAQKFIDIGKAEALKDLPRWETAENSDLFIIEGSLVSPCFASYVTLQSHVNKGDRFLKIEDLKKLPGFKD